MTRRPDLHPAPRVALGLALRRLRDNAGLEGQALAARIGISPDLYSRFELGKRIVRQHHIEAIITALELDDDEAADLREQFTDAEELDRILRSTAPYRPKKAQEDRNKLLADASRIDCFAITEIPFFLQDAEYALQEVGDIPDARQVADLRADAGRQIGQPGKKFNVVISEAALRFWPCDARAMRGQLAYLGGLIHKPGITFGIIPFDATLSEPLKNAFTVFDQQTVLDTYGGELLLTPKQTPFYNTLFTSLAGDAAYLDAATAILNRAIKALPNE